MSSITLDESTPPGDSTWELAELIGILWRRKILIAGAIAMLTAIAAAASFLMTPVYRSETVLTLAQPVEGGSSLGALLDQAGGLASIAGLNVRMEDAADEALAMLRSRKFTEEFIDRHDLLPKLLGEQWSRRELPIKTAEERRYWMTKAYRIFDRGVRRAFEDRRTGLITVQIDWRDSEEAALWANDLVMQLNAAMRKRAIAEADALIGALEREVDRTHVVPVRQAIYRLVESQVKQRALASARDEFAFRVIDPAYPANRDAPVRPKPVLYMAAGPMIGLVLGVFLALMLESFRAPVAAGRRRGAARDL